MGNIKRRICEQCGNRMNTVESRVAAAGKQMSGKSRKRVGWICSAAGCDNIVRTWFPKSGN